MTFDREITIETANGRLSGSLCVPFHSPAIVLFAHGTGSSRNSPRNQFVAQQLQKVGLSTLMLDLLTSQEETVDELNGHKRFDIELLSLRVSQAIEWLGIDASTHDLPIGLFGASTGSAAAMVAAAKNTKVKAVVSRGGRVDLATDFLPMVEAPTLLIVGQNDQPVLNLNTLAIELLKCPKQLKIIPDASHLFEEPGALDQVAAQASIWFCKYLAPGLPLQEELEPELEAVQSNLPT
ncbi:MAG: alpha/beta family hydrolase [Candidatus Melainabacteria bacterium]|nr:alpha/beta family hydrolase [Candidatus Melainabacteria bacterium]